MQGTKKLVKTIKYDLTKAVKNFAALVISGEYDISIAMITELQELLSEMKADIIRMKGVDINSSVD